LSVINRQLTIANQQLAIGNGTVILAEIGWVGGKLREMYTGRRAKKMMLAAAASLAAKGGSKSSV